MSGKERGRATPAPALVRRAAPGLALLLLIPGTGACQDGETPRVTPETATTGDALVSRVGADPGLAPLDSLLALSVAAYGGESALAKTGRMLQRGRVTSRMRGGAEGRILRVFDRPARLRVEIAYPGAEAEVRILDGGAGWRNGVRSTGPMHSAMLLQAARLSLPGVFADFQGRLLDLGEVERDGGRLRAVGLDFHGGLRLVAELDPASGRILRSEGLVLGPDGSAVLSFATEYADFRDVQGAMLPFLETNYAQGTRTGETRLESVELVEEIPDGAFQPTAEPPDPRAAPPART